MSLKSRLGARSHRTAIMRTASNLSSCADADKDSPVPLRWYASVAKNNAGSEKAPVVKLLLMSMMLLPATVSADETPPIVVADGGPVVWQGTQGRPDQVDINNANAQGLSHNQYVDFHISERGIQLNNETANASLIVNEVTGDSVSQLNGDLIVKGKPADIVVSNHNGIDCNGCGFVNTNRNVLTTGIPVFEQGKLAALQVNQGKINIGEQGAIVYDRLGINPGKIDLIAAGVTVNGFIHGGLMSRREQDKLAEEDRPGTSALGGVQIIAGKQTISLKQASADQGIDYDELERSHRVVGEDEKIDVTELGGMYARQIYLYGNGAGIGVNSNGSIHGVENLVISTTGNLTLNTHIRAIDTIDISGADKFINLNQLEASKVIFKDIGYFRNGDDLETLKRPEQLSWMASMGFQNIKAKDINISAREFHNHGKIQADNTLTLNAQQAYNLSGELIANDLKVKAADLIHKTHIFDADKLPVTETVYKAECYDDYCWQYEDKIQAPRKKYQDIPARTARMSGTDRLQINVSNDLKITGAIVESSAGSVHINAENSINISSSAWEEKTTSSHNHTQKWLFIPVKVSQTKESIIKQTLLRASISAHKELELKSRGRIMAKGTSLSGDHVDISSSAGNIDIESFYLTNFSTKESSRAGFLGMNRTGTITDTVEGVPIDTEILPRQKLALSAVSGNIRLDNAHFLLPLNQDESITGTNIAITAQKVIKVTQPHVSATETRAQ